jgi:hypothetical protein
MRDDPDELARVESLVPLIARHTELSSGTIDQKRSAPDKALPIDGPEPARKLRCDSRHRRDARGASRTSL